MSCEYVNKRRLLYEYRYRYSTYTVPVQYRNNMVDIGDVSR